MTPEVSHEFFSDTVGCTDVPVFRHPGAANIFTKVRPAVSARCPAEKGPVADAVQSRFFEVIAERPAEYEEWFTDV